MIIKGGKIGTERLSEGEVRVKLTGGRFAEVNDDSTVVRVTCMECGDHDLIQLIGGGPMAPHEVTEALSTWQHECERL